MASRLMGQERRRSPRVDGQVALAITNGVGPVEAETKNLSASGVYCTLDHFLPPMTKLQLRFELPDGERRVVVSCTGVVVRVEPVIANPDRPRYNVAIFFTDLSERDRTAIERFVRQRLHPAPSTE